MTGSQYSLFAALYYLKEHKSGFWIILDKINGFLFQFFLSKKLYAVLATNLSSEKASEFNFRLIQKNDLPQLLELYKNLEDQLKKYFEPHDFSASQLAKQLSNKSFVMMGAFYKQKMVGYFFLRCGINKKCFVGRLVHKDYRNQGIGKAMNRIMYNTAWDFSFRVFASISKMNSLVLKSHISNPHLLIRKELKDNYLLVEFVKDAIVKKPCLNSIKSHLQLHPLLNE